MAGKRVLLVTYYWPPSGGPGVQRVLKFVKYLPRFDVSPYVLTVSNPTYSIIDSTLQEDVPEHIPVFKSKSIEPFGFYARLSGRSVDDLAKPTIKLEKADTWLGKIAVWIRANLFVPDARIGWMVTARHKTSDIINLHDIDTVITTGPPHSAHFAGKHAKEKCGIRWIADFRDPWTEIFYNKALPRTKPVRKLDRTLEKTVLKSADEVLVSSPSIKKLQNSIHRRKYRLITNGFDPDDFPEKRSGTDSERSYTIRHVGNISEARVPEGLLTAVSELPDDLDFKLEFIGNVHSGVNRMIDRLNLQQKVEIKPYLPHEKAIRAMVESDLLLLIIADSEKMIIPGKIFEYFGSGTPIMFIGPRDGDACNILNEMGNKNCFKHSEVTRQKEFLVSQISRPERDREENDIKDRWHHPYSRLTLTEKLAKLI